MSTNKEQECWIKPCPFCGEVLVEHCDHHGKWMAHRQEPGPCIFSVVQIMDEKDVAAWNKRAAPSVYDGGSSSASGGSTPKSPVVAAPVEEEKK